MADPGAVAGEVLEVLLRCGWCWSCCCVADPGVVVAGRLVLDLLRWKRNIQHIS